MATEYRGTKALELWARRVTADYSDIAIQNMTTSWRNGLAFCAIIHHFRPDLIDITSLHPDNILENNRLAFSIGAKHLGVPALLDPEDMVQTSVPDRLSILTYVSQVYQAFNSLGLIGTDGKCINKKSDSVGQTSEPTLSVKSEVNIDQHEPSEEQPSNPHSPTRGKSEEFGDVLGFKRNICVCCSSSVFLAEKVIVGSPGQLLHRACFRCIYCSLQLSLSSYCITENGSFSCRSCRFYKAKENVKKNEITTTVAHDLNDSKTANSDEGEIVSEKNNEKTKSIVEDSDQVDGKVLTEGKGELKQEESSRPLEVDNDLSFSDDSKCPALASGSEHTSVLDESKTEEIIASGEDDIVVSVASLVLKYNSSCKSENSADKNQVFAMKPSVSPLSPTLDDSESIKERSNSPDVEKKFSSVDNESGFQNESEDIGTCAESLKSSSDVIPSNRSSINSGDSSNKPDIMMQNDESIVNEHENTKSEENSDETRCEMEKEQIEFCYPEELNPFESEESEIDAEVETSQLTNPNNRSSTYNPFGSENENESDETGSVSVCYDDSLNPFMSDEDVASPSKPPRPPPPTERKENNILGCGVKLKKKVRPAPAPPSSSLTPVPKTDASCLKSEKDRVNNSHKETRLNERLSYLKGDNVLNAMGLRDKLRRKKGPAPSLPTPVKRTILKLPLHSIQQELKDIEVKQSELERQGVLIEKIIRETSEANPTKESDRTTEAEATDNSKAAVNLSTDDKGSGDLEHLILNLFELVNEKNELFRRQAELMFLKRENRLEEEYVELEYQIRCLMMKPQSERTEEDASLEAQLIDRLVKVVEERDDVVNCLEIERQRGLVEDESIATHLIKYQGKIITEHGQGSQQSKSEEEKLAKKKKKNKKHFDSLLKSGRKVVVRKKRFRESKEKGPDVDKDIDDSENKHCKSGNTT